MGNGGGSGNWRLTSALHLETLSGLDACARPGIRPARVGFVRRSAFPAALPILLLWASSKLLSQMAQPAAASAAQRECLEKDRTFLRRAALRTWRYFAEFSTEEHNWLHTG